MSWIELAASRRPQQMPQGVKPPENAADWYRISNSVEESDTTDIYVYDSVGGWFGVYADDFIRDLKAVSTKNINLRINSPGGSVFEGIAIANALRSHPANVTVYVDGLAASIASVIALAGNRLVMMPQSQLMIHDASGACYGNAADMEYMVGLLSKQSDNIADAYAARAGGTAAEWRDLMKAETWYSAQEAVDAGLADEVMPVPAREPEDRLALAAQMHTAWDLSMYRYAGREKAPAPAAAAPFAFAGAVFNSAVTAPVQPVATATELTTVQVTLTGAELADLIRNAVREEMKALAASPPEPVEDANPFAEPDEDAEDALGPEEEVEDASDPETVEDAEKKKLPPFLQPDEDEEEDEEPEDAADPVEPEASAPETTPEEPVATAPVDVGSTAAVPDTEDFWSQVVAQLTESPSLSADDEFNRLKEAWT